MQAGTSQNPYQPPTSALWNSPNSSDSSNHTLENLRR